MAATTQHSLRPGTLLTPDHRLWKDPTKDEISHVKNLTGLSNKQLAKRMRVSTKTISNQLNKEIIDFTFWRTLLSLIPDHKVQSSAEAELGEDTSCAVVFTHIGSLAKSEKDANNRETEIVADLQEKFRRFIDCNKTRLNIGLIYAYMDIGINSIKVLNHQVILDAEAETTEEVLKHHAQVAWEKALSETTVVRPPKLFPIGMNDLRQVFASVIESNPQLIDILKSPGTYDHPKWVEAVIRLARGDNHFLSKDPILRFDDDVHVNAEGICQILLSYKNTSEERRPFYWYSGCYGGDSHTDPINDYAVRTHFFFPEGTTGTDFVDPDDQIQTGIKAANIFLSDLAYLGAPQNLLQPTHSEAVRRLQLAPIERQAQVISGAGLVCGYRNIRFLPPFISFNKNVIWIDDFLKRLLHESLGDLVPGNPESIQAAKFKQDRSASTGIDWYLKRLAPGCMMSAVLYDESALSYGAAIRKIIITQNDKPLTRKEKSAMATHLKKIAGARLKQALACWQSDEFRQDNLDEDLATWAAGIDAKEQQAWLNELVENLMNYLDLVAIWPQFCTAITRLDVTKCRWLYTPINR